MTKAQIILVRYYTTAEEKGEDKKTIGYATKNDARLEADHFRHTLESNSKTNLLSWKSFTKRSEKETIELRSKTI